MEILRNLGNIFSSFHFRVLNFALKQKSKIKIMKTGNKISEISEFSIWPFLTYINKSHSR